MKGVLKLLSFLSTLGIVLFMRFLGFDIGDGEFWVVLALFLVFGLSSFIDGLTTSEE